MRIDNYLPHSSFRLDGEEYMVKQFYNGQVECERNDGEIVWLPGHLQIEQYSPRKSWLGALIP